MVVEGPAPAARRCGVTRPRAKAAPVDPPRIAGVDFSSAPRARKPITIAEGHLAGALLITAHRRLPSLDAFDQWLAVPDACVAGCDFPFGLPRRFLSDQGWGVDPDTPEAGEPTWDEITRRVAALERQELVARCRAWSAARPFGSKFAHRVTDGPAGSSPSMKWVNPPVVLMLHAGAPRLLAAGWTLPGLRRGDPRRIGFEAYPGMLAREVAGRVSYKADDARRHDPARRAVRLAIVERLEDGRHRLGIRVAFAPGLREPCIEDGTGDTLDAVLCAVQAAWGWERRDRGYGLPPAVDPLEGWTVGAPWSEATSCAPAPASPSRRRSPARTPSA